MTTVPVRDEAEELACTLRVTVPLPVFEAEEEMVIQEEFDDAIQVQVLPVVTCTDEVTACWSSDKLLVLTE